MNENVCFVRCVDINISHLMRQVLGAFKGNYRGLFHQGRTLAYNSFAKKRKHRGMGIEKLCHMRHSVHTVPNGRTRTPGPGLDKL
jgi:hypothetical protein